MNHQVLWTSPPRGWKDSCHPPVVIPRIEQLPQRSQEQSRFTVVYDAKYGGGFCGNCWKIRKKSIFICLVTCQIYTSPPTIGKKIIKPFYLEYHGFLYHFCHFQLVAMIVQRVNADTGRASKLLGGFVCSDSLGM